MGRIQTVGDDTSATGGTVIESNGAEIGLVDRTVAIHSDSGSAKILGLMTLGQAGDVSGIGCFGVNFFRLEIL